MKRAIGPIAVGTLIAVLYLSRLGDAPIYLMPDEVVVGVNARALATTGRDEFQHRLLPLFVQYDRLMVDHRGQRGIRVSWLPPAIFYAVALGLKVWPFSEAAIRMPTAIIGIVDVLLMYFIGRRLFRNEWLAALGAVLLALTPAHFMHSRMAADYVFPLPFMLAWLLCLLAYLETGRQRMLWLASGWLGIGLYSYAASVLVMPLYLLITLAVLWRQGNPPRAYVAAALPFLLLALPGLGWVATHPRMIADVLFKYELNDTGRLTALQGLRSLLTYHRIGDQLGLYWAFFNPRFLFFDGPMEPMYSTRQVGVFLLPTAALLLAGIAAAVRTGQQPSRLLMLAGFVTAPLAATIVNVNDAIYRALEMLPFAALLAVAGAEWLWSSRLFRPNRMFFVAAGTALLMVDAVYAVRVLATQSRLPGAAVPAAILGALIVAFGLLAARLRVGQTIVLGLVALVPMQFLSFATDYFGDYRRRSAIAFSGNIRGAFEETLRQEHQLRAPAVYLGEIGSYAMGPLYWKFYLTKHGRLDLLDRTVNEYLFYPDRVLALPAGSLIVTNAGDGPVDAGVDQMVAAGELERTVIHEPDGTSTFLVLRRSKKS